MRIRDGEVHRDQLSSAGGEGVQVGEAHHGRGEGDEAQVLADGREEQNEKVQREELRVQTWTVDQGDRDPRRVEEQNRRRRAETSSTPGPAAASERRWKPGR